MGGVLSQLIDYKWHPVAYRSQSLSPVEHNYEIHDRELLAIMRALEDWRPYLLGAVHPFEIWTDHQNLTYFKKAQKLNRRQARWHTELQVYDFNLIHKPGAQMRRAGILSRLSEHVDGKEDNKDIVLLHPKLFIGTVELVTLEEDLLSRIRAKARLLEDSVTKGLATASSEWERDGELMYREGRICVPKDEAL